MNKIYNIPFIGLKLGHHLFEYKVNKTFFDDFEYDEFNDVNIDIHLDFEKKSTFLELLFSAKGTVNINCDITNEAYNQNIDDEFKLVVKFGDTYNADNVDIVIVQHGTYEINVAQYIYELIILAVPTKRVHPGVEDGTLKSDILTKLQELEPKDNTTQSEDTDPRWDNLKKLLTDK